MKKCRERAGQHFRMMKHISRGNDENLVEKYFQAYDPPMSPGRFRGLSRDFRTLLMTFGSEF